MLALLVTACSSGRSPDPSSGPRVRPSDGTQVGVGSKPNVLVIVTDDQRSDGTMEMLPATRRIFGRGGTRFPNAFATTPLCCPSRASLFSGKYAHNHGVLRNEESDALAQDTTIQRYLADAGYRNAIFGKYLMGFHATQDPPHFHDWATKRGDRYYGGKWNVQGEVRRIKRYATDFVAAKSLRFLDSTETEDARPWFLVVTPQAPHAPATLPPRHQGARIPPLRPNPAMLEDDRSDKPPYVRDREQTWQSRRAFRGKQLRSLLAVDELVDAVFKKLADLDERGTTLAFFLSDNGSMWGEHQLGSKRHPYTQSVAVPLFARWPGEIPTDRRDGRIAAVLDVPVTILDAVEIEPDAPMDGHSLLTTQKRTRILLEFWNEVNIPTWASLRTLRYQYIEYYRGDGTTGFREYYDLDDDPWQLVNLLRDGDHTNDPDTTRLRARLRADRGCEAASCP